MERNGNILQDGAIATASWVKVMKHVILTIFWVISVFVSYPLLLASWMVSLIIWLFSLGHVNLHLVIGRATHSFNNWQERLSTLAFI